MLLYKIFLELVEEEIKRSENEKDKKKRRHRKMLIVFLENEQKKLPKI